MEKLRTADSFFINLVSRISGAEAYQSARYRPNFDYASPTGAFVTHLIAPLAERSFRYNVGDDPSLVDMARHLVASVVDAGAGVTVPLVALHMGNPLLAVELKIGYNAAADSIFYVGSSLLQSRVKRPSISPRIG